MSSSYSTLLIISSLFVVLLFHSVFSCKCRVPDGSEHCSVDYNEPVVVIRGTPYNRTLSNDGSTITYWVTVNEVLFNNVDIPVFFNQGIRLLTNSGSATCEAQLKLNQSYFIRFNVVTNTQRNELEFRISSCSYIVKANPWDATETLTCGELLDDCLRFPCRPDQKCEEASISCFTIPCPQRTCVAQ